MGFQDDWVEQTRQRTEQERDWIPCDDVAEFCGR